MNVRHPTSADLSSVLAVLRASDEAVMGESDWTGDDLRELWDELDLERDAWVVELDGQLAGYADFEARPAGRLVADGYVRPEMRGRGVGSELLRLTEARAAEELSAANGRLYLQNGTLLDDPSTPALYEQHGYRAVRHQWRMLIELAAAPSPRVPPGIAVRALQVGEERAVHDALEEAFADNWEHQPRTYEEYAKGTFGRPGHDPALCFVALEAGEIVGASLNEWKRHGDWGWIGTIGVRPAWRRRGIAEALLQTSFAEFFRRGERRIALGVDAQSSTGATRLYEGVGMHVHYRVVVYEKELRAA